MKLILRLWLVTFGIIILWIYFLFISPKIFNNRIIEIPDVVNLSEADAVEILNEKKIKYQITYIESTEERTLKTIPYAGTSVKANYVVSLYIGKLCQLLIKAI